MIAPSFATHRIGSPSAAHTLELFLGNLSSTLEVRFMMTPSRISAMLSLCRPRLSVLEEAVDRSEEVPDPFNREQRGSSTKSQHRYRARQASLCQLSLVTIGLMTTLE